MLRKHMLPLYKQSVELYERVAKDKADVRHLDDISEGISLLQQILLRNIFESYRTGKQIQADNNDDSSFITDVHTLICSFTIARAKILLETANEESYPLAENLLGTAIDGLSQLTSHPLARCQDAKIRAAILHAHFCKLFIIKQRLNAIDDDQKFTSHGQLLRYVEANEIREKIARLPDRTSRKYYISMLSQFTGGIDAPLTETPSAPPLPPIPIGTTVSPAKAADAERTRLRKRKRPTRRRLSDDEVAEEKIPKPKRRKMREKNDPKIKGLLAKLSEYTTNQDTNNIKATHLRLLKYLESKADKLFDTGNFLEAREHYLDAIDHATALKLPCLSLHLSVLHTFDADLNKLHRDEQLARAKMMLYYINDRNLDVLFTQTTKPGFQKQFAEHKKLANHIMDGPPPFPVPTATVANAGMFAGLSILRSAAMDEEPEEIATATTTTYASNQQHHLPN